MEGSVPPEVDTERANAARMYDFFLGGAHHFAVDREHAAKLVEANPDSVFLARSNRDYLARVVRWCVRRGIDQFLDLGSGVPTVGNVHQIAHETLPRARVAYVDIEPVAVAHGREIVAGLDTVTTTRADLADPDAVLGAAGVADLLDLRRPAAVLAVSCLHFVPGDLRPVMERYRAALVPGSVLAISHAAADAEDDETTERIRAMAAAFAGSASHPVPRTRGALGELFGTYRIVEPGIVDITRWPDATAGARPAGFHAAVGVAP